METWVKVCKNCMDFNSNNNTCGIRYNIHKDKTKTPMKRKPSQKGCEGFLMKTLYAPKEVEK